MSHDADGTEDRRTYWPLLSFFDLLSPCSPCTRWAQAVQMLFSEGFPHSMHTGFFLVSMVRPS